MSLGKKVADFGYRTFTVGMLSLTVYGSVLIGQRVVTLIKGKEATNPIVKDHQIELPVNIEKDNKQ